MVTHTQNLCFALTHLKRTHTVVNTHPEQWADIYAAAPGEQLGVRCLAQGWYCGWRESAVHSLPPPTIPAGPETTYTYIYTHSLFFYLPYC